MEPLGDKDIRASFVNCSKGEASRISLPRGLAELPWADLDFLGWRDPGAPDRGYLVAERDGALVGVTLRVPQGGSRSLTKTTMCSLCLTAHGGSGVSLLAARKVGPAGRDGNTVGAYMCADLACPLYVRGKRTPVLAMKYKESLTLEERLARMTGNLQEFLDRVFRTESAAAAR
ncbi:FBP domain-containing protein [Streptomyces sp. ISL-11]|uniref:FBP domain-containing protein n=1 Tax=Streptomyces sp. ISL-11 TaxID=2819174 RepID=UPI001BE847C2|nr:FBP domain-containing protein [Streptomyces sp. ISL-11]MBT2386994.1 FBP domain-containing protein [Streptomyces sp. ISL-11]